MAKKKERTDNVKIEIIKPVAGAYHLSANVGQIIEINEKQAATMIESGHAKEVK